jgi:hypothetical protein
MRRFPAFCICCLYFLCVLFYHRPNVKKPMCSSACPARTPSTPPPHTPCTHFCSSLPYSDNLKLKHSHIPTPTQPYCPALHSLHVRTQESHWSEAIPGPVCFQGCLPSKFVHAYLHQHCRDFGGVKPTSPRLISYTDSLLHPTALHFRYVHVQESRVEYSYPWPLCFACIPCGFANSVNAIFLKHVRKLFSFFLCSV